MTGTPQTLAPNEPSRDMVEAAYPLLGDMNPRRARELCRQVYIAMLERAPKARRGGLTKNQRRVHEVITETLDDTREIPSLREIAQMVGFKDHSSAFRVVRALKRKGIIDVGPGHRDIKLLKRPEEV